MSTHPKWVWLVTNEPDDEVKWGARPLCAGQYLGPHTLHIMVPTTRKTTAAPAAATGQPRLSDGLRRNILRW